MMTSLNSFKTTSRIFDNDLLSKYAPSVFSSSASEKTSERYSQIPTIKVVDALRGEGWYPVFAQQTKARDKAKREYSKHLLRFRHQNDLQSFVVGDTFNEIVLVNSHDGTSAYQLNAGVFRLACANGMVVCENEINTQRVRHSGDVVGNVLEGVYTIVEDIPTVNESISNFKSIQLSSFESTELAKAAATLRWDEYEMPLEPQKLLTPRRREDLKGDLWTTFNVIQENLIKGGLKGRKVAEDGTVKRHKTRAINSVGENVRLNKALWALAEAMASHKSALICVDDLFVLR